MEYPCGWVSPFGHCRIKACCQLPDTFRRLPRPSSPLTAKASTVCAYSLDHITRSRLRADHSFRLCFTNDTSRQTSSQRLLRPRFSMNCEQDLSVLPLNSQKCALFIHATVFWWSQPGSNRRPPACKAGALPAELWPRCLGSLRFLEQSVHGCTGSCEGMRILVGLGGLEPPTSPLSGVRSNHLSYRPKAGAARLIVAALATVAIGGYGHGCRCLVRAPDG
jgi:hypothetical protein